MNNIYKVTYRMVDYPTIHIQADSEGEALDLASRVDGSLFDPGDYRDAVWELHDSEIVSSSPIFNVFTKADVEELEETE